MLLPQLKIAIFPSVQNYDFAPFKFTVSPLVLFCFSQLNYDFALNLNLHFCNRFCLFPSKITILPPVYNYRPKMGNSAKKLSGTSPLAQLIYDFIPALKLRFCHQFKITFLPTVKKIMLLPLTKNYHFALDTKLRFDPFKFTVLPLLLFFSLTQPNYNFAFNLNLHFAIVFLCFPIQITILPPV
ncbi:hypothetical protein Hanom_Chr06g00530471 [Helianthus anomalus]